MRKLLVTLMVLLAAVPVMAQDAAPTITDLVVEGESFTVLEAAVIEAELAETLSGGEFTVFAPRDGAFETLLNDLDVTAEDLLAREDLAAILTYHVVPGTVTSADLVELASERNDGVVEVETVNGAMLTLQVGEDGVTINNGAATVVQADVAASNGVVHVIDNVLLPPMDMEEDMTDEEMSEEDMTEGNTIVDLAVATEDLSILTTAVLEAELAETLAEGEFTVFAPRNGAFETLLEELDVTAEDLLAREDLAAILTYHVVEGTVTAADLTEMASERNDGLVEVETVNGATLRIQVGEDGVVINDGEATVAQADIMASNGVVHVIDNVLLPPAEMEADMADEEMSDMSESTIAEIVSADERFSVLAAALTEAELVEVFEGEDAYTVFAPTNEAFANLLASTGLTQEELLASDVLTPTLLYHVVAGTVMAEDVVAADGESVETLLEGNSVSIEVTEDGAVLLNGVVTVTTTDIVASNGVVHVIDNVLLPQSTIDALSGTTDTE